MAENGPGESTTSERANERLHPPDPEAPSRFHPLRFVPSVRQQMSGRVPGKGIARAERRDREQLATGRDLGLQQHCHQSTARRRGRSNARGQLPIHPTCWLGTLRRARSDRSGAARCSTASAPPEEKEAARTHSWYPIERTHVHSLVSHSVTVASFDPAAKYLLATISTEVLGRRRRDEPPSGIQIKGSRRDRRDAHSMHRRGGGERRDRDVAVHGAEKQGASVGEESLVRLSVRESLGSGRGERGDDAPRAPSAPP